MVVFTCNACGESVKKAQVEKHVNKCRGCQVLSCMDCGKDFCGEDYRNHIKCITEDQKYGGKAFEAKAHKGEVKQQQWIQRIHEAMNKPGVSPKMKDILGQVTAYDNIPRKKAKFQNWMKNSLRLTNPKIQDEVWEIFSAATTHGAEAPSKPSTTPEEETPTAVEVQNGASEKEEEKKKKLNKRERKEARQQKNGKVKKAASNDTAAEQGGKSKKRKHASEEEEEENRDQNGQSGGDEASTKKRKKSKDCSDEDQDESQLADEVEERQVSKGKFNWKGTIKAVIRKSDDQELSVKKLRKKVLAAYYSFSGESNFKSEEQVLALFNKKIKGNPKFRVLKDKVKLVN